MLGIFSNNCWVRVIYPDLVTEHTFHWSDAKKDDFPYKEDLYKLAFPILANMNTY